MKLKIQTPRIPTLTLDDGKAIRTLTKARKEKLKKAVKYKCQKCGKKFKPHQLEVHHKKGLARFHKKYLLPMLKVVGTGEKRKTPAYDLDKNLVVLCKICHSDVEKAKRDKAKTKKNKSDILNFDLRI